MGAEPQFARNPIVALLHGVKGKVRGAHQWYTDLEETNKMDEKPFLEINLTDLRPTQIEELKKFHKSYFDVDNVMSTANELKYMRELKVELAEEFESPSAEFVKFLCKRIIRGSFTAKVQEQFTALVKRALNSYVNDVLSARLKTAIGEEGQEVAQSISESGNTPKEQEETAESLPETKDSRIVTTEEELEGFHVVRAIVRSVIPVERVAARDTIAYFGILADDNNRRPICRLHFNGKQKYLGLFDDQKKETRYPIAKIDDIFDFTEQLHEAARRYL